MLGTRSAWEFFVQILEYFHMYNKIPWGWDSWVNMKCIGVSYTLSRPSLKVTLHIFSAPGLHHRRADV